MCLCNEDPSDYTRFNPPEITFAMTSMNGAVQCVQIGIVDEILTESDEQFEISLVLPDSDDDDGGSLLAVTIVDNEGTYAHNSYIIIVLRNCTYIEAFINSSPDCL